jgi:hypothetical protein
MIGCGRASSSGTSRQLRRLRVGDRDHVQAAGASLKCASHRQQGVLVRPKVAGLKAVVDVGGDSKPILAVGCLQRERADIVAAPLNIDDHARELARVLSVPVSIPAAPAETGRNDEGEGGIRSAVRARRSRQSGGRCRWSGQGDHRRNSVRGLQRPRLRPGVALISDDAEWVNVPTDDRFDGPEGFRPDFE